MSQLDDRNVIPILDGGGLATQLQLLGSMPVVIPNWDEVSKKVMYMYVLCNLPTRN